MALQMNVVSSTGYEFKSAYIKIDEYSCFGEKVNARLRAYVSQQMSAERKSSIEGSEDIISLTVDYSDEAPNTKKQIYEYVKKTEKYNTAADI